MHEFKQADLIALDRLLQQSYNYLDQITELCIPSMENRERQRAYRMRMKRRGFKAVNLYVSEIVAAFIKENPQMLTEAFIEINRDRYIDFTIAMEAEGGDRWYLSNGDQMITITAPGQVEALRGLRSDPAWKGAVRVYVNGSVALAPVVS